MKLDVVELVRTSNLRRGPGNIRNNVFALYEDGFLCWHLNATNNSINNYSEFAALEKYPHTRRRFVDETAELPDTAAFISMDIPAYNTLAGMSDIDTEALRETGLCIPAKNMFDIHTG